MQNQALFRTKAAEHIVQHYILWTFLLVCVISLIGCGVFYLSHGALFYTDTDCYTRALRIIDWLDDFQWAEKIFPYFNPPHGFILHFTRACDVIWLILSAPFMPFLPLKDAIFYGGMLFSPLFMFCSIAVILWGIRPYLPPMPNKNSIFIIFALIGVALFGKLTFIFSFSRPDHHSLMAFVMCACIAVILRNQIQGNLRHLFTCGLLCGLGMWASSAIEGLFAVAVMLTVLVFNRIFYNRDGKELIYFALGLFLSVTAAWLINPPYGGYTEIDINRLSIIHSVLTALMLLAFLALNLIKSRNKFILIAAFGIAALICAGMMLMIFGGDNLLVSIYDPYISKHFLPFVSEMRHQSPSGYEMPLFILGLCSLAVLLYVGKFRQQYLTDLLIIFMPICIAALMYRRFFPYYLVTAVYIYALTLFIAAYGAQKKEVFKWVAFFYILIPVFYLATFHYKYQKSTLPEIKSPILTDLFKAPEIMFFYGVDSVGGPYHVNVEGIKDNHTMWFTTDEQKLKNLLKKHHVQAVYLWPYPHSDYYVLPKDNTDKLYGKVLTGENIYPWLKKIDDRYYEVDYSAF